MNIDGRWNKFNIPEEAIVNLPLFQEGRYVAKKPLEPVTFKRLNPRISITQPSLNVASQGTAKRDSDEENQNACLEEESKGETKINLEPIKREVTTITSQSENEEEKLNFEEKLNDKVKQNIIDVDKQQTHLSIEDALEKVLANNPGNFVRKRAVTVDLTEFESLRRQLEHSQADGLIELTKNREEQRRLAIEAKGGLRGASKEEIGYAFHMHKLRGMLELTKRRCNQTEAVASSLKSHFIRHLEELKPETFGVDPMEQMAEKVKLHTQVGAAEMASSQGSEQKNEAMVQNMHLSRSTKFKLEDYIKAYNDSNNDFKELEESHGSVDLSPNTKLRIL